MRSVAVALSFNLTQKAIEDIKEENITLKAVFQGYAQQSLQNSLELAAIVGVPEEVETGQSVSGTLHRAWIDVNHCSEAATAQVFYRKRNAERTPSRRLTRMHWPTETSLPAQSTPSGAGLKKSMPPMMG